ncbi:hypothetical protein D3C72_2136400 [compost metagenome]
MQPQFFRDVSQDERAHGHFTLFKERLLSVNNRFCHFQDGVKPLLNVFYQPARLLQLAAQIMAAALLL